MSEQLSALAVYEVGFLFGNGVTQCVIAGLCS